MCEHKVHKLRNGNTVAPFVIDLPRDNLGVLVTQGFNFWINFYQNKIPVSILRIFNGNDDYIKVILETKVGNKESNAVSVSCSKNAYTRWKVRIGYS